MKKIALIMFAVSICTWAVNAQELKNGSFEDWTNSKNAPSDWSLAYKGSFIKKSNDARTGKNSVRMVLNPTKPNDNKRFKSGNLSLSKGSYTVTLFLKGEGEIRYISFTESEGKPGSKQSKTNRIGTPNIGSVDNKDWKQYDLKFDIPADGEYSLNIAFNRGSEEAPFLLDDVSIKKD